MLITATVTPGRIRSLLSLNRVAPEKGIQYFVEWNKALKLEGDVVGDDRLIVQNREYPKQIRQLAKDTTVAYHGLVTQEQKLKFLTEASAVVLLPQEPYFEEHVLAMLARSHRPRGRIIAT